MPLPPYRFIDYNEMLVKPADVDVIAIFDIDAGPGGELKKIKFGTWKSFFVMRDEDTDIAADHEYQTNKKLKHGSAGEYEQYHDAIDMYFVSTTSAGKMIFKLNSLTALTFYPATTSIGIGGWNLSNDGGAADGIKINLAGNLQILKNIGLGTGFISYSGANSGISINAAHRILLSHELVVTGETTHSEILRQNANIDLASNWINGLGTSGGGLTFAGGINATFNNNVTIDGETIHNDKLRQNENIDLDANFLNRDGADSKGLQFTSISGSAKFWQTLDVIGALTGGGNADFSSGWVKAENGFRAAGGASGVNFGPGVITNLTIIGGIVTAAS